MQFFSVQAHGENESKHGWTYGAPALFFNVWDTRWILNRYMWQAAHTLLSPGCIRGGLSPGGKHCSARSLTLNSAHQKLWKLPHLVNERCVATGLLKIMNEALLVDPQPSRLWVLMASAAWSLMCMCWDKDLLHACLGPRQLDSAINHLLYVLFLACSLAPCWLQRIGSIIKQIKADCRVNFHPILPSGCRDIMHESKSPSWNATEQNYKLAKNVWGAHLFPGFCLMAQFYAATPMRQGGSNHFSQSRR